MNISMIRFNRLLFSTMVVFTLFGLILSSSPFMEIEYEMGRTEFSGTNDYACLQQGDESAEDVIPGSLLNRNDIRPMVNVPPTASIWCPVNASTVFPVLMDASNSTDTDGTIVEYWWSFGDGTQYIESDILAPDGSFDGITSHEYSDDGQYTVTLNVTDNNSSVSIKVSIPINIVNRPPVAKLTAPDTLYSGETLYLDGSVSFDLDGQIVNHTWIIDGIIYSYRSLELINFTTLGLHDILLKVRDDDDSESQILHEITISNRLPVARARYNRTSHYFNGVVEFNASLSIDYGGTIVSYKWDLGDGTTKTGIIVSHKYLESGVYYVTLTVTDDQGGKDIDQLTIVVENLPPVADAGSDISTLAGQPTILSAYRCFDSDGTVDEFIWDFGDGNSARGISVNHVYNSPGSYLVTLSIIDNMGSMGVDTLNLTVINKAPEPEFSVVPTVPLPGRKVIFNAADSRDPDGHIVLYQWDIGDRNPSVKTGVEVQHVFNERGNYSVTLSIEDELGMKENLTRIIMVDDIPPVPDAGPDIVVIQGTLVRFNASGTQGQGDITKYEWAFEDKGGTDVLLSGISPSYTFLGTGEFPVLLKVTDEGGKWSTDSLTISVKSSGGFHLIKAYPGPEETDVLPNTIIELGFSGPVDRTLVDIHTSIKGEDNSSCSVIINISNDGKQIYFIPTAPLHFGMKYFILISPELTDIYTNRLVSGINISFTVISPFELISTSIRNTSGFDPKHSIEIEFNRAPDASQLTGLLRLLGPKDTELEIGIIQGIGDNNITIVPVKQLDFDTSYKLVMDNGAKCLLGGPMEDDYLLEFGTRSAYQGELSSSRKNETPIWMTYLLVSILTVILILALYFLLIKRKRKSGDFFGRLSVKNEKRGSGQEPFDPSGRRRRRERERSAERDRTSRNTYDSGGHSGRERSSERDRRSQPDSHHRGRRRDRMIDDDDDRVSRSRGGVRERRKRRERGGERRHSRERGDDNRFAFRRDDYSEGRRSRYSTDQDDSHHYDEYEINPYKEGQYNDRSDDYFYFKDEKKKGEDLYFEEDEGRDDDYYYEDEGGDDDYYYEDDEGGDEDYYEEDESPDDDYYYEDNFDLDDDYY